MIEALEFLETKTILIIIHVFGAIIGAGSAFVSDNIFFRSIKDGKITKTEMSFLNLGGNLVWFGIALLIASGIGLVYLDPQHYLTSEKFLAKISIVAIIVVNGILFHSIHLPLLKNNMGIKLSDSKKVKNALPFILASGVISSISWTATIILGIIKSVPYSYEKMMITYVILIVIGITFSMIMRKRIFDV